MAIGAGAERLAEWWQELPHQSDSPLNLTSLEWDDNSYLHTKYFVRCRYTNASLCMHAASAKSVIQLLRV